MDWLSKFEQADRQEAEARRLKIAQEEQARADEAARFRPVIAAVRPVLERQAAQVSERLGIRLILAVEDRAITMGTPKPVGSTLRAAHPFWFALSDADVNSVRVVAVAAGWRYRGGEPPDDMSAADYYGTDRTAVGVRVALDDLMTGDLDRLVEWLVASHRTGGLGGTPKLRIVETREAERAAQTATRQRLTGTAWTIGCCLVVVVVVINIWNFVGMLWRTFSR
jgi:hypothetical protein